MSDDIFVTHIGNCVPESGHINPIELIYKQGEDSSVFFLRGMEGRPLSLIELNTQVANDEVIELNEPFHIKSSQSLFLFENGKVVCADSELGPLKDKNKMPVDLRLSERAGLPITRMERFGWLLKFDVRSEDILATDLPLEIDNSFRELQEEYLTDLSDKFYFANLAYPEDVDSGLSSLIKRLREVLGEHLAKKIRNHPKKTYDLVSQGYPTTPTFLPFPFFWRQGVKDFWGVLRYARQTKMGIVITKNHPEYALENKYGFGLKLDTDFAVRSFLANERGAFYSFNGYVFEEIGSRLLLKLAKADSEHADCVFEYQKRCIPRPKSTEELQHVLDTLQTGRGQNDDASGSVLLFDPGETAELERELSKKKYEDIRFMTFDHHEDVPVGFGFSHSALPVILKDGFWRKILAAIDEEFAKLPSRSITSLATLGIELNKRVLPKTYEECSSKSSFYVSEFVN